MTAIASVYLSPKGFVIATDGRCKSDDESDKRFETEQDQKIFPIVNVHGTFAYAVIGFAGTNDGTFKLVDEINKVAETLANRRFDDCTLYMHKFCHKLQQVLNKARREKRITEFPKNENLPLDRRSGVFRLLFVGYFKQLPYDVEARFFHDEKDHVHFALTYSNLGKVHSSITGSDIIAKALLVDNDPRFERYCAPSPERTLEWAEKYVRGYIEACCDPLALGLDPLCKAIGGHIHVAEITHDNGFRWRTPPLSERV